MTHPSLLVMSWEGIADFPCLLASSALEKYQQLPSKGKPLKGKEWTPMAAIIQHDASMSELLCVTGVDPGFEIGGGGVPESTRKNFQCHTHFQAHNQVWAPWT